MEAGDGAINGKNVNVTGTEIAEPPVGVMVIVPLVFALRPVTFTPIESATPLLVPLAEEDPLMVSQLWLLAAVYPTFGPPLDVTLNDCTGGFTPGAVVKVNDGGVAAKPAVTLKVTPTVSPLFWMPLALEVSVIVPL
jgi:hypothetical protein